MTNEEFISALEELRFYLKPALFTVLRENAAVFSIETKTEIISKLREADTQMHELYDYQEKRNSIMKKGLEKMNEIYVSAKTKFLTIGQNEQASERTEADELISKL